MQEYNFKKFILTLLSIISISSSLVAQLPDSTAASPPPKTSTDSTTTTSTPKKKWSFLVEPYVMFPYMKGTVSVNNLGLISVDADPQDIFSRLQFGAMIYLEADKGNWDFNSDLLYMNINQDGGGTFLVAANLTAKQLGWEVAVLYKVTPWLEFGIGGLLNSISSEADVTYKDFGDGTHQSASGESTVTWYDPMLVLRIRNMPQKKFIYSFRAEIGGTGGGTDLAWQIQAYAGYQFTKLFQLTGGYRTIDLYYDRSFRYDVNTFGPVIRFGFNF